MRRPFWCLDVYLGHMRSGKSTLAYERLTGWGRGVYITFRGVPDHIKARPWTITDSDEDLRDLDYYLRNYPLLQIKVMRGRLVNVIEKLRGRERLNVVFDDVYQLVTQDRRTRADAAIALDTFLSEAGQRGVCVTMTTHKPKKQLTTFVQDNANLFWIGPARKPQTIKELYELSELPLTRVEFARAIYDNPIRHAFALRAKG